MLTETEVLLKFEGLKLDTAQEIVANHGYYFHITADNGQYKPFTRLLERRCIVIEVDNGVISKVCGVG